MTVLEQIDNINWESLGYPHMPTWLRNLTSDNPSIRKQSLDCLYDGRVMEITDASPYLIPFLLELLNLAEDKVQDKHELLNLLMQTASEASIQPDNAIAQSTLKEIENGTHLYLSFLENSENGNIAFALLGYLRGRFDQIAPVLFPMLNQRDRKAPAAYTLYELLLRDDGVIAQENKQKYIDGFSPLLSPNESDYVRIAAAMVLSNVMGTQAPLEIDGIFREALSRIHIETRAYASSAYSLIQALVELGAARAINILARVISSLDNPIDIFQILPALLDLGFNNGVLVKYSRAMRKNDNALSEIVFTPLSEIHTSQSPCLILNPVQHRILGVLLDNDAVWTLETNLFQLHGLPPSREELKRLLTNM